MSKERFTAQQVADAVYEAKGLSSIAARRLGVDAKVVRNYAAKYDLVRNAIVQAREDLKDFAESKLLTRIDEGDMTAIIFYLKTQAKDRGYVERQELTGADNKPLQIETYSYERAIAAIAPRPVGNRLTSGAHQNGVDGEALGEDDDGGGVGG